MPRAVNRKILRPTKFTRCARCGAVAPRVLGTPATKIADKAQAGRLFCALPRVAYGTLMVLNMPLFKLARLYCVAHHQRRVNSTLCDMG